MRQRASQAAVAGPVSLSLALPLPPSANKLFKNLQGRGRAKTQTYESWRVEAGWTLKQQLNGSRIGGAVSVAILCARKDMRSGDIDNRIKPILDLLVSYGTIDDDRNVQKVSAEWVDGGRFEGVSVEVRAV